MAEKARHAFGNSENLQQAVDSGVIDSYDILFLDGDTDPKIGWITKDGEPVIVKPTSVLEEQITIIETEMANKISAEEADAKISDAVNEKVEEVVAETVETIVINEVETVVNNKIEDMVDDSMSEKINEAVTNAKDYTDEKIAEIMDASFNEVVEF